ncbi:diaminopimelate decarboxylase [Leucobacter sp. OLJS4]|uniref:diaminopimelate decarboxylase n=1 Tax=unclassified Leucobacter TaxID=2621730 RepID=UPI000C177388|nr:MULTISPECIES: diaminopimelate decarboxylase [unclassified Leucobacter]PIJ55237.1 diaminopimelate decarboxylase [Leucobacter sp. OLES1]PII82879.1 diaminopimelate decarboxylase [Leucobacter sp. OLCALW19]PII88013.1 diaminopimelate decarboxylase [Leucobacter sp. OLTLW20]PII91871.1 diaminopimelate decarboxylase [Leucobacter sp. OLAS13]PII99488.1 diaminopimelate decarboxylase [Leucobacter sp. OLCS4]
MTDAMRSDDLNAIDQRVFPPAARRGSECGQLKLGGIRATELVERFGSPLYVVDEDAARARAREIRGALQREFARIGTEATVYYAGKAFLCVEVARWMSEEGLNIDVASGGELAVALAAGVDPARIGFHGNNKSEHEIARAVAAGVGTLILDSVQEIARVSAAATEAGIRQRVRLRVNSGVHASTHDFLATSHEDQKFGLPLDRAVEVVALIAAEPALDFAGLHCHIGSQIFATDGFRESARRLVGVYGALAEVLGAPVPELNLGGGFGIAYTPAQAEEEPEVAAIARELADIVAASCAEAGIPIPRVAFEPGRSVIGQAGVTLYTVGTTKPVSLRGSDADADPADLGHAERLYVSVDGGMSDNARPALYGADYHVRLANRRSEAGAALVRVVGKHCESGDIVVQRDLLPGDVAPGDLLAVAATGAYCWSLSSNYNYVPRPPVVAVREGDARTIVRGETEDELLARSVFEPLPNGGSK